MEWWEGPEMVFQVALDKSKPQTDLMCLTYKEINTKEMKP